MKKALCVGCNYPVRSVGLLGSVNDAFMMADMLIKHCEFDPENVKVLYDVEPGQKKSVKVPEEKIPTKSNILQNLNWLISSAKCGDTLFFSFSGYGVQVDDLDGYQDEGYDEAILPTDFVEGMAGECSVILTADLADILTNVPPNCSLTVVMDCDHSSTVVDTSGTLEGDLVPGLKLQSLWCGVTTHSTKTEMVEHNKHVWSDESARAYKTRPRFHPSLAISSPSKDKIPNRSAMGRVNPAACCYGASRADQTALELQLPKFGEPDHPDALRQSHGVLSWSFVRAFKRLNCSCTHNELLRGIEEETRKIRARYVPQMDQTLLFTFTRPAADPATMKVCQPCFNPRLKQMYSMRDTPIENKPNIENKESPRNGHVRSSGSSAPKQERVRSVKTRDIDVTQTPGVTSPRRIRNDDRDIAVHSLPRPRSDTILPPSPSPPPPPPPPDHSASTPLAGYGPFGAPFEDFGSKNGVSSHAHVGFGPTVPSASTTTPTPPTSPRPTVNEVGPLRVSEERRSSARPSSPSPTHSETDENISSQDGVGMLGPFNIFHSSTLSFPLTSSQPLLLTTNKASIPRPHIAAPSMSKMPPLQPLMTQSTMLPSGKLNLPPSTTGSIYSGNSMLSTETRSVSSSQGFSGLQPSFSLQLANLPQTPLLTSRQIPTNNPLPFLRTYSRSRTSMSDSHSLGTVGHASEAYSLSPQYRAR